MITNGEERGEGLHQPAESRTEIVLSGLSPETRQLIKEMQGQDGYAVYATAGNTPAAAIRVERQPLLYLDSQEKLVRFDGIPFSHLSSKLTDVSAAPALLAFRPKPSAIFLPRSKNIPHDDQLKLIPAEQERVDRKYPGAGLVVREGALPEWIELGFAHFKAGERVRIFGPKYGYSSTWTSTYESEKPGADRAYFGSWDETVGPSGTLFHHDAVDPHWGLAVVVEIPMK